MRAGVAAPSPAVPDATAPQAAARQAAAPQQASAPQAAGGVPATSQATAPTSPAVTGRPAAAGAVSRTGAAAAAAEESPLLQLQRTVRRQQALAHTPGKDVVWQPRFAYSSAVVILVALTVVSLPLWIVLYRITDSATLNGSGPRVADLVALCMMLLGGFLTSAAAWVIIIEMRGRVRMVDTLARTGEREVLIAPASDATGYDVPVESYPVTEPVPSAATLAAARLEARLEAQANAAATLEASSKLLSSFSSVLKTFGQLPAQVAMLAVALALFVGATVLSLNH
ncbi:MAG TPA: hypothetical protein VF163_04130 [Micromonosporaceae bacterium]